LALTFGAVRLTGDSLSAQILLQIRLPRVAATLLCGAALAAAGLLCQTLLSNPLASPTLLGINSGAGLAVALCGVLLPVGSAATPAFALAGAVGAAVLVYALSARVGSRRGTIILAGVAVGGILSAGIDALHTLVPEALPGYNAFLLGGFAGIGWGRIWPSATLIFVALIAAFFWTRTLDVFALGDDTAATLGVRVSATRAVLIVLIASLAGAAVSVCGLLGFVGLLTPHIVRRLFPTGTTRVQLVGCLLCGGALVTLCDLLARTLFAPYELPAGIFLNLLGGPFFLYLLLRRRGHA
jgi:iron complex transport system permease protein